MVPSRLKDADHDCGAPKIDKIEAGIQGQTQMRQKYRNTGTQRQRQRQRQKRQKDKEAETKTKPNQTNIKKERQRDKAPPRQNMRFKSMKAKHTRVQMHDEINQPRVTEAKIIRRMQKSHSANIGQDSSHRMHYVSDVFSLIFLLFFYDSNENLMLAGIL